jgi:hypothetical protein
VAQFDNKPQLPTQSESENQIAEQAPEAVSYLRRTDNLDILEALGLSTYLEEGDEQTTRSNRGSDRGKQRNDRFDDDDDIQSSGAATREASGSNQKEHPDLPDRS